MHTWPVMLTMAAAGGLLNFAQGYMIDTDSCKGDDFTFVHDMVEQAFAMAEASIEAVKKDPPTAETNTLLTSLFNTVPDENGRNDVGKALILDTFEAKAPSTVPIWKGILGFRPEKTGHPKDIKDDKRDVVIYCDEKRFKRTLRDPAHLWDPNIEAATSKTGCASPAFAYTWSEPRRADFIQICPWFLEYSKKMKWKTGVDVKSIRGKLASNGADKWITNRKYTPIDLVSLWDKVMLHEMTHTKAGGLKEDVGGFGGYGWKNCKDLAQRSGEDAANNADTYALFGSAIVMINAGVVINEDGNFVAPGPQPNGPQGRIEGNSRRGLPWSG